MSEAAPYTAPYILLGWHLSYFSGKTRAYLRFKGVPFVDREVDALNLLWRIPRRTGATVMPVVVTPQGEWLQDSSHIVDVLEARFPQPPVLPAGPRQRIAALLLEAWCDEWWIPAAMHYRWSYPENYALFEHDAGRALLPRAPGVLQRRIAAFIAGRLRGYLPSVGVVPEQFALMERWTEAMLDALERHFAVHPYLFGTRPSVADFALYGPLYGHLSRDPAPRRLLVEPRPRLRAWVERLGAEPAGAGAFIADDALPDTLQPLFAALFNEFLPMVQGIRDEVRKVLPARSRTRPRLPRALGMIEFPMGAGRFRRLAMPYTLWMMQRVADGYRGLDAAGQSAVADWLRSQGQPQALQLGLPRLRRTGLHVAVED
jgi:glutathione S-transferase